MGLEINFGFDVTDMVCLRAVLQLLCTTLRLRVTLLGLLGCTEVAAFA